MPNELPFYFVCLAVTQVNRTFCGMLMESIFAIGIFLKFDTLTQYHALIEQEPDMSSEKNSVKILVIHYLNIIAYLALNISTFYLFYVLFVSIMHSICFLQYYAFHLLCYSH